MLRLVLSLFVFVRHVSADQEAERRPYEYIGREVLATGDARRGDGSRHAVHCQLYRPFGIFVRNNRGERPSKRRMARRKGTAAEISGEEFSVTIAHVRTIAVENQLHASVQNEAVNRCLGGENTGALRVLIMREQTRQVDSSGGSSRAICQAIRDVRAGLVPRGVDLPRHRLVVGDQHPCGADDHRIPEQCLIHKWRVVAETDLKGSFNQVPLILSDCLHHPRHAVSE